MAAHEDLSYQALQTENRSLRQRVDELERLVAHLQTQTTAHPQHNALYHLDEQLGTSSHATELQRVNRAFRALHYCNEAVIRATEEQTMLNRVCQIVVEEGGYRFVWVGFAQPAPNKEIVPKAYAGYEAGYLRTVVITWSEMAHGQGPAGTAIRTQQPAICRDIATDEQFAVWRDEAVARGYASVISLPLHTNEQTFGIIAVYAAEPDAFDQREIGLLTNLADNLAYGIVALQNQSELTYRGEKLRALFAAMVDAILVVDRQGICIDVPSSRFPYLEDPPEEIIGKSLHDIFPSHDAKSFLNAISRAFETHSVINFDYSFLAKEENREVWFNVSISEVTEESALCVIRDITERKRSERVVQESEARLRTIIERSVDPLVVNSGGVVLFVNPAAEALFGRTAEELLGEEFGVPMVGNQKAEVDILNRHGSRSVGEMRVVEIEWEGDKASLTSFRDITEHKQLEEELEELVHERTSRWLIELSERVKAERAVLSRDAILEAVGAVAQRFLRSTTFQEELPRVLERLGKAINVTRVALFAVHRDEEGVFCAQRRDEWLNPKIYDTPETANSDEAPDPPASSALNVSTDHTHSPLLTAPALNCRDFATWQEQLPCDIPIYGDVVSFPEEERAVLEQQHIRNLLVIPIFVRGEWWGFLEFDECYADQEWTIAKIEALKAAATILGEVIQRDLVQKELQKSEERFRMLAENAPDIIYRYRFAEPRGFEYISPSVENILGYMPEEFYADPDICIQISAPESVQDIYLLYSTPQESHQPITIHVFRKDGQDIWIEQRWWLIFDEEKTLTAIEGIGRDITERKRAEEELQRAWRAAKDAARAKSEFLANMSHEIRTPINAVVGMTNLLLDTELTSEQLDYAETISLSSTTLLILINDILDFSKIEAGKVVLEQQPFDVRECVEEALDLLAPKAAEKGINLAYMMDHDIPHHLVGDSGRLRQILVNLVSNGVKFTEQGEVFVCVSGQDAPSYSDNQHTPEDLIDYILHVKVQDTGIGIAKNNVSHLFESFSQVDTSMTRKYGGTGLGLAISRRFAEIMGGTIWVESVEDQGSLFHVTVKLGRSTSDKPSSADEHALIHLLRGKRVLIICSNPTNCHILSDYLRQWGMHPFVIRSEEEALERLRAGETFGVAILDIHTVDKEHLSVVRAIRQICSAESLPILVWTTITLRGEMTNKGSANALGPDDVCSFLIKPIRPLPLYNTLVNIFQKQEGETHSRTLSPSPSSRIRKPIDSTLAQRHPLTILLAEDNIVNQKVALRMLEKFGYRADVEPNGQGVLRALEQQRYDVILMDVQMPEMDGVEATHRIREQWPTNQQPRIVAMTAHAIQGYREWLLGEGMDDYVSKPVQLEELAMALKRVPQRQEQTDPTAMSVVEQSVEQPVEQVEEVMLPTLDTETFEEFVALMAGDEPEEATEFLDLFLEDTANQFQIMREAMASNDWTILSRSAHSVKSSSAQLGAMQLSEHCRWIEESGKEMDNSIASKLDEAEQEFAQVRSTIGQMYG